MSDVENPGRTASMPGPGRHGPALYLLLTATVDPRGVDALARSDPLERLGDYLWALGLWADCPDVDGLIFVENSGYALDELRAVVRGRRHEESIEFLSYDGQDFPRHLGKGYGENLNVEHVLANSAFLTSDEIRMLRVNGRNYVDNVKAFVDALKAPTEVLCDFKQQLSWGDGRVLGGTVRFFRDYACPYGRAVNDAEGYYYEHALARAIHRALADGLVWSPLPERPHIRGYSGTSNVDHAENVVVRKGRDLKHELRLRMLRD